MEDVNMTSGTNRFFKNAIIAYTIFCLLVVGAAPSAFGEKSSIPRPEHPKPQFKRDAWTNLNGQWDFVTDLQVVGITENWQNKEACGN